MGDGRAADLPDPPREDTKSTIHRAIAFGEFGVEVAYLIVQTLKDLGFRVGMTGDGVNHFSAIGGGSSSCCGSSSSNNNVSMNPLHNLITSSDSTAGPYISEMRPSDYSRDQGDVTIQNTQVELPPNIGPNS